jgi:hypothetical protein
MSQLTHPITTFRSHWIVVSAALLALAATAAVMLVLALGRSSSESNDTPVTPNTSSPDVRYDGGGGEPLVLDSAAWRPLRRWPRRGPLTQPLGSVVIEIGASSACPPVCSRGVRGSFPRSSPLVAGRTRRNRRPR